MIGPMDLVLHTLLSFCDKFTWFGLAKWIIQAKDTKSHQVVPWEANVKDYSPTE